MEYYILVASSQDYVIHSVYHQTLVDQSPYPYHSKNHQMHNRKPSLKYPILSSYSHRDENDLHELL